MYIAPIYVINPAFNYPLNIFQSYGKSNKLHHLTDHLFNKLISYFSMHNKKYVIKQNTGPKPDGNFLYCIHFLITDIIIQLMENLSPYCTFFCLCSIVLTNLGFQKSHHKIWVGLGYSGKPTNRPTKYTYNFQSSAIH